MSACIILKKDLEKLGKKLMKKFYDHIHDDFYLKFNEVKLKREYYNENLTKEFLSFHEKKEQNFKKLYFDNKRYKDLVEMKTEDLLKKIEEKIKDETLDFEIIYNFLDKMDIKLKINEQIEFETYEDLFCMKKAFIHMFEVFDYKYLYLYLED